MKRLSYGWIFLLLAGLLATSDQLSASGTGERGPTLLERSPRLQERLEREAPQSRIKVDVRLILVPVTVLDPIGRIVHGLEAENFRVFDDREEQEIVSFSSQDAPISVGLIFDLSGSMSGKIDKARQAVQAFFGTMNPEDEAFLVTFSDRPDLRVEFTSRFEKIQNALLFSKTEGRTALIDAVFLGLHQSMRNARNLRRALVVISDGGDNSSRYTLRELRRISVEADTQIYAIGIHDNPRTREELYGAHLLRDIAEQSGGRHFVIRHVNQLDDVATKIGVALHNQYVLGYYPPEEMPAGKYRNIRVRLNAPRGLPPLRVYARSGYYAPEW